MNQTQVEDEKFMSYCKVALDKGTFLFKDDEKKYWVVLAKQEFSTYKRPHIIIRCFDGDSVHLFDLAEMRFKYHSDKLEESIELYVLRLIEFWQKQRSLDS